MKSILTCEGSLCIRLLLGLWLKSDVRNYNSRLQYCSNSVCYWFQSLLVTARLGAQQFRVPTAIHVGAGRKASLLESATLQCNYADLSSIKVTMKFRLKPFFKKKKFQLTCNYFSIMFSSINWQNSMLPSQNPVVYCSPVSYTHLTLPTILLV